MTEVSQLLQNFASICVSGVDALSLMQGQFTADLRLLVDGQTMYCAYCDVKGKVGWIFLITYQDSKYYLTMPREILPSFLQEFKKYAVFSQVEIKSIDEQVYGQLDEHLHAIDKKIPLIYLTTQFKYFPHDLRLAEINALSFTKGCFKGQEIIARMEHRGNIKRRTYIINHEHPVEIAAVIMAGEEEVGSVVRTFNSRSLAVINEQYLTHDLTIENMPITIVR
jgi:folate-binding protein YgfZ